MGYRCLNNFCILWWSILNCQTNKKNNNFAIIVRLVLPKKTNKNNFIVKKTWKSHTLHERKRCWIFIEKNTINNNNNNKNEYSWTNQINIRQQQQQQTNKQQQNHKQKQQCLFVFFSRKCISQRPTILFLKNNFQ